MSSAKNLSAYWFDISALSDEEKIIAICAQGLVNRDGPNLLLKSGFWNWRPADDIWREHFEKEKGFGFTNLGSLGDVIGLAGAKCAGAVAYDPEMPETWWIGANLCGLEGLVPMTAEMAAKLGVPVKEDLRGRFQNALEAMRWAFGNLRPRCHDRIAHSVHKLWSGWSYDSLDWAVAHRSFVFSLKLTDEFPEEKALADEIMESYQPTMSLFGWGEPEEDYSNLVSRHGHHIHCSEAPNLTFHAGVPCARTEWKQIRPHWTPDTVKVEDKHYLGFIYSEGDALKIHTVFQAGAWTDPSRGHVPINWGFQPMMVDFAPALAEYYLDRMTPADYFCVGPSGAGYNYPNRLKHRELFFRHTGEYLKKSGMSIIECWLHFDRDTYEEYARLSGAGGFTMPCGPPGTVEIVNGNVPALLRGGPLNYTDPKKGVDGLVEEIINVHKDLPRPSFMTAFLVPDLRMEGDPVQKNGYSPTQLREVVSRLDPNLFKVTHVDEIAAAASAVRA